MDEASRQENSSVTVQMGKWLLSATGNTVIMIVLLLYGFYSFQQQHDQLTLAVREMSQSLDETYIATVWTTLTPEQRKALAPIVMEKLDRKLRKLDPGLARKLERQQGRNGEFLSQ